MKNAGGALYTRRLAQTAEGICGLEKATDKFVVESRAVDICLLRALCQPACTGLVAKVPGLESAANSEH